jgi:hypothetical protein
MARLNLNQIAEAYRRSPKTFRKYVRELKIPHIQLGREMLFDPAEVERHLVSLSESGDRAAPDLKAKPAAKRTTRGPRPEAKRYAEMLGI